MIKHTIRHQLGRFEPSDRPVTAQIGRAFGKCAICGEHADVADKSRVCVATDTDARLPGAGTETAYDQVFDMTLGDDGVWKYVPPCDESTPSRRPPPQKTR
jgi:hypothetical protein